MVKLDFSNIDISRDVLPSLTSTLDNLDDLISVNSAMYIPGDFRYAGYLNEYRNFIVDMRKEYRNIKNWLTDSNKKYDEAIDEINTNLAAIAIDDIADRGNSVD